MHEQKPHQVDIPDKLYFKIGEVSKISGLPSHVLRFWESEFRKIKPRRTESGQRSYTRKDIETILEIKHLLYEQKFTLEGARRFLDTPKKGRTGHTRGVLEDIRAELKTIRDMLADN